MRLEYWNGEPENADAILIYSISFQRLWNGKEQEKYIVTYRILPHSNIPNHLLFPVIPPPLSVSQEMIWNGGMAHDSARWGYSRSLPPSAGDRRVQGSLRACITAGKTRFLCHFGRGETFLDAPVTV